MEVTKQKAKENSEAIYSIKEMDRPKEIVHTIHGRFIIATNDPKFSNAPTCSGCFYRYRKGIGAPCVENTWCGNLYQYLNPFALNKYGIKLQEKRNINKKR